jgi:uncharacterized membrane protein YeaQ/YmgE (transglycosylase-associated protein family)
MISDIITSIIGGAILGVLARFILPGKQNISITVTVIAGMVAAFVGTLIARLFGFHDTRGIDWWERILQLALAVAAVSFAAQRFQRKVRPGTRPPMTPGSTPSSGA